MDKVLLIKILTALHLTFAAFFVGGNVFMDFILTPRLELIPPGQAARLGEKMGNDFALFNWVCLIGLIVVGSLLIWQKDLASQMTEGDFWSSPYGSALAIKEFIWTTLVITGAIMTFYLRPRVIVKLPYDASREEIEDDREKTIQYADWMRYLARYNGIAATVALITGAFLAKGGFWT
jgi:uncharacterized membrane protein